MSTFSYLSYVDYSQTGNSVNIQQGSETASVSTLQESGSDGFFSVGETFSSGEAGTFFGTFTDGGSNVYVVVQMTTSPNATFRIYSPLDATTTLANLPNVIHSGDVLSGGDINKSDFAACFLAGTMIATAFGEVPVETLRRGDVLRDHTGREATVKWIGRQTIATFFGPAERLMPVRIAAGALGGGLPHTDLTVTADHGMLVDGVICHAGALVNGTTITQVPLSEMGPRYVVYHVETEAHEIILANGAPAETFIDNASRRSFDNFAEFEALYGDVPEMEELPYPRAMSARQVPPRIKAKLDGDKAA